ncbi:TP901 family phage tail tape measure protein [Kitasatospora sp. MAP12-15]|uniref:phage tail tape measure protein n=1 Tax=unclassified Kitasatospora TaxID=2633591 RepID=UPI002473D707|nr:phage tail tape measure protein [Kitasatospora sp. MAP12-44]
MVALKAVGEAAIGTAEKTIEMAADFQTAMTRVQTGAGESARNMKMVGDGVLNMAGQVGMSTEQLTTGLYTVESAGYHGADALNVLKVSAQGARVGAAELGPVTDAVTTALNAYSLKATDATGVMNALVATEAAGKTNMEALAGSMSSILPVASAAHVGLNEILGAMATMTSQGTSADVAATYLRQTIGQLSNPSAKAAQEMAGLGLNATQVAQDLGKKGLAATLGELTDAIQSKMGPAGTVIIETLRKASANTTQYQKALANLKPAEQTYIGALATMVGGTKSMMGALQLTGDHMETFKENTASIAEHVKAGGKSVEGWADVQKTFNQRIAEARATIEALGIRIGTALMPYAEKMIDVFMRGVTWLEKHRQVVILLGAAIGGVLVVGLAAATASALAFAGAVLANPVTWLVVGVMALAAGLVYLVTHWREVYSWVETKTPGVVKAFREGWAVAMAAFRVVWDVSVKAVKEAAEWLDKNVLKWVMARIRELVSWWKDHSAEISAFWKLLCEETKVLAQVLFDWLKDAIAIVVDVLSTGWKVLLAVVKFVWTNISNAVELGMHFVENIIAVVLDVVTGHWGKALSDVWRLISQAFTDIVNFLGGLVSSFGTLLWDAGGALIQGLVKGIEAGGSAVLSALKGVAKGALNGVKSFLGINSPSKVFADEIGQWIPHGIAAGVAAHAGVATGAVGGLAASLTGQLGSPTLAGLEPAFAGPLGAADASGTTGQQITVHVTVNGSVMADQDLANTIQRVMLQNGARNTSTYAPFRR